MDKKKKNIILGTVAAVTVLSVGSALFDPAEPVESTYSEPSGIVTEQTAPVNVNPPFTTTAEPDTTTDPSETTESPKSSETQKITEEPKSSETANPEKTEKVTSAEVSKSVTERDYVLNTNTMRFHKPSCSSVKDIEDYNREDYHGTRDEVIARGFSACKRCNP